jgi:hypothetical protein
VSLALSDTHLELAATVRRWTEARNTIGAARAGLELEHAVLPELW